MPASGFSTGSWLLQAGVTALDRILHSFTAATRTLACPSGICSRMRTTQALRRIRLRRRCWPDAIQWPAQRVLERDRRQWRLRAGIYQSDRRDSRRHPVDSAAGGWCARRHAERCCRSDDCALVGGLYAGDVSAFAGTSAELKIIHAAAAALVVLVVESGRCFLVHARGTGIWRGHRLGGRARCRVSK